MTDGPDADDQDLLARLRAADPASALPPAAPEGVARLLEETMSHDVDTPVSTESRATGTRGRSSLTWSVAAAAVLVIIGGAVAIGTVRDDVPEEPPVAADPPPTVTELAAPGAVPARCAVPSAERLAGAEVAFDGTVDSVDDGLVTLTPTEFYAGDATDIVTIEAPAAAYERLLTSVDFTPGGRYLVAASSGGDVMVCGFSAPWSEGLARLYEQAFGG